MTSITRVQIMVNGSQDVMFRDVVSLNQDLELNLSISKKNNEVNEYETAIAGIAAGFVLGEVLVLQMQEAVNVWLTVSF